MCITTFFSFRVNCFEVEPDNIVFLNFIRNAFKMVLAIVQSNKGFNMVYIKFGQFLISFPEGDWS